MERPLHGGFVPGRAGAVREAPRAIPGNFRPECAHRYSRLNQHLVIAALADTAKPPLIAYDGEEIDGLGTLQ